MKVRTAARNTLKKAKIRKACGIFRRDSDGMGLSHAGWMLIEVGTEKVTGEKAHRWLGWAQSIIVNHGYLELKECKDINHAA